MPLTSERERLQHLLSAERQYLAELGQERTHKAVSFWIRIGHLPSGLGRSFVTTSLAGSKDRIVELACFGRDRSENPQPPRP